MNTPVAESSAELFVAVLRDAFLQHRGDSDLLYARRDLGKLFNEPAMQYIERQGGQVRLGQRFTTEDRTGPGERPDQFRR